MKYKNLKKDSSVDDHLDNLFLAVTDMFWSMRFDDDISSVCASFNLEVINKKIKNIRIAYGGMASIPKRAKYCEKLLLNSSITEQVINKAKEALEKDFEPISDMRASKKYRMEVAKNLLKKCFLEITQKKLIRVNN